jgi:hypothetical protein
MNISAELNEYWRQCTDDQLAGWYRDPKLWSYVLRAPNGKVIANGKVKDRRECEEWAVRHAEAYVDENAMVVIHDGVKGPAFASLEERLASDWTLDHHWAWHLLGEWHLVLWPPVDSRPVDSCPSCSSGMRPVNIRSQR